MTRAYLRLDPGFGDRKEHYPDGAVAAYVLTLCLAEHQPDRGHFRDEEKLRRLLGKRGRWVPYLLDHGDLIGLPDGRLYVDGWVEWQEGDWKVGERMSRVRAKRNRNRNADRNSERHPPSDSGGGGADISGGAGGGPSPADVLDFRRAMADYGYKPKDVA